MNPQFDVEHFNDSTYKQILDIKAPRQINDWYDLLGVDRFENSISVIDRAMLHRFQRVRQYQVGNLEQEALVLIDELSRAYACLTSEQERLEYEESLRMATSNGETKPAEELPAENSPKAEKAAATVDPNQCAKCGQPTSPKAPACYHCGHKKATVLERRVKKARRSEAASLKSSSMHDLVKQDLSPEQLLARLQETRQLVRAGKLAAGRWKAPRKIGKNQEPGSKCRRCGRGLLHQSTAYGIQQAELRQSLE